MLNGAIAGTIARTTSAPLDLLKIRFQLQAAGPLHATGHVALYPSVVSAIKQVYAQEGLLVPGRYS